MALKVIALISGGKDSLYSILHCISNGHEVVALGNLHPKAGDGGNEEETDLDSYMYQTVGHSIIPLYEQALKIPLYRQEITGGAVNTDKDYAPASNTDETESLIPLLQRIMAERPEANAISTGAILSTYQRTRVESVATRLGLTPLSFLWQYPFLPPYTQTSLLEDIFAVGQDARIIKIASGGLDESFLWQNVADPRTVTKLQTRMSRFGAGNGAVLGEGGEFETLALDGPRPLWKGRIEVEDFKVHVTGGGGAAVEPQGAVVIQKRATEDGKGLSKLRKPGLFDDEFAKVLNQLKHPERPVPSQGVRNQLQSNETTMQSGQYHQSINSIGDTLFISNLHDTTKTTPQEQLTTVIKNVQEHLASYDMQPFIVSSTLLLRSMSDFVSLNPIYGSLFTRPNPASRVTVACGHLMPDGVHIMLSLVLQLQKDSREPRGLHVQSRSYWAPANIGPYSQAIAVPLPTKYGSDSVELVHIAGQIPLVPVTMELVTAADLPTDSELVRAEKYLDFKIQAVLALQHLWRVGRAMQVACWTGAVAFLPSCKRDEADVRKDIAQMAWKLIHQVSVPVEEDDNAEDVDVWDLTHGAQSRSFADPQSLGRAPLPDYECIKSSRSDGLLSPPCFICQVDELPRRADIEWSSSGLSSGHSTIQVDKHLDMDVIHVDGFTIVWAAFTELKQLLGLENALKSLTFGKAGSQFSSVVYATEMLPEKWLADWQPQIVPCRRIWGASGELKVVVMIRCIAL